MMEVDKEAKVKHLVEELYQFRDHFFENHELSEAKRKQEKVSEKLQECLKSLDHLDIGTDIQEPSKKAHFLCYRGRALNILPDHDPDAETLLSKAAKLDPSLVMAWNELGECYWKRGDINAAKTCFEGALQHSRNKISLRNLSIVTRQCGAESNEERQKNIELGLEKAKEAVQLDTSDGISWSILGNAYLMHFFSVSQNPKTLKQAMSAYKQAEKDSIAASSSELHYNKGVALKYEEDYNAALNSFDKAEALDPTWEEPIKQRKSLIQSLSNISHLIETKGKLKMKRVNNLVSSIHENQLGPYGSGKYSSPVSGSSVKLDLINFEELKEGVNHEKVILGKVICSVHSGESVPFTFCLIDRKGQCLAVNLYNLAPGKGVIIGDTVAIAEPYFSHVNVNHNESVIKFDLVRVESPLILVINGRKASSDFQAGIQLSTFTKSD